MYVTNMEHFGHLKEVDTYTTNYLHNDMFQLFDNRLVWNLFLFFFNLYTHKFLCEHSTLSEGHL